MNVTIGEALREEYLLHAATHVGATRVVETLAAKNDGDLKYVVNRLEESRLSRMDRFELSPPLRPVRRRNQIAAAFSFVVTRPATTAGGACCQRRRHQHGGGPDHPLDVKAPTQRRCAWAREPCAPHGGREPMDHLPKRTAEEQETLARCDEA